MNRPPTRRESSTLTMGQLMGVVAAAASLCALVATVRSLDDGGGRLTILGACCVGYTFYLVYLVWLSFSYFTRSQVLVLLAATAALATLAIQVVVGASGWPVLVAIIALPITPFALGALVFRYGGHWAPEPDFEADTGTLALLVHSKRGRGLTPQQEGCRAGADRPSRRRLSRRTLVVLLILAPGVVALLVGGISLVRRRLHYQTLAAAQAREEERCFEQVLRLEERNEAELAKDPDSPEVQERVERRKRLAEQWNKKADWHSDKRRSYEDRWW